MECVHVATLVGRPQVAMAQACLASLQRASRRAVRIVIHGDGTLNDRDRDELARSIPDAILVPPRDADERVAVALARHPACRAYRASSALARKLLDVALVGDADTMYYCDADVLFLRPFTDLFERPVGVDAVFQADQQEAYSVRSWDFLRHPRLRLVSRVNTGIVVFRRAGYDLDRLEWFLTRDAWRLRSPEWLEQTAWACLAGRLECRLLDPEQVTLAGVPAADPVAIHFVSSRRDGLETALANLRDRSGDTPVHVRSSPAYRCGPLRLLRSELRRRLSR